MRSGRGHRWTSLRGVAGGLAMFIIEGLTVAALAGLALIVSVVVLAVV
ncbi:MAG TPA: hypothetical protein VGC03_03410 [Acidimicrobiia bacterium]